MRQRLIGASRNSSASTPSRRTTISLAMPCFFSARIVRASSSALSSTSAMNDAVHTVGDLRLQRERKRRALLGRTLRANPAAVAVTRSAARWPDRCRCPGTRCVVQALEGAKSFAEYADRSRRRCPGRRSSRPVRIASHPELDLRLRTLPVNFHAFSSRFVIAICEQPGVAGGPQSRLHVPVDRCGPDAPR